MQTFLPYPDFRKSLQTLDYRRLGKQRVEAMQLVKAIYIEDYGWRKHPCCKMRMDYPEALQLYHDIAIDEWIKRGYNNNMPLFRVKESEVTMPHWLGNEQLHASHRSNLLAKDFGHYGGFGWDESDDIPYYWCGYGKDES